MPKKLFRIEYHTSILIEAEDEREAEYIGDHHLEDEIQNGTSEIWGITTIEHPDQLRREERGSLPWRNWDRRDEPELTVEEILNNVSR